MGNAELFLGMNVSVKERQTLKEKHGLSFQSINSTGRFGETLFEKIMHVNVSLAYTKFQAYSKFTLVDSQEPLDTQESGVPLEAKEIKTQRG